MHPPERGRLDVVDAAPGAHRSRKAEVDGGDDVAETAREDGAPGLGYRRLSPWRALEPLGDQIRPRRVVAVQAAGRQQSRGRDLRVCQQQVMHRELCLVGLPP